MLASMAKAAEFNAAEIKDCKTQVIKKDNAELMERVLEMERYKCRWNLRIRGIKENDGENTQEMVANLLIKISPLWASNIELTTEEETDTSMDTESLNNT